MAAYELLLLNTAIPQIQAAQSGDTYLVPRDIAFSTVANLANGTNLLPSLTFSSDTNTGIYREGADALGFTAGGGTNQMVLTSTGLGIGTNNPTTKLYVTVSAASAACVAFFNTDTANGNGVYIKAGGANAGKYALAVENAAGASLAYLDSSGNLGLGVTPSAWSGVTALQVGSGAALYDFSSANVVLGSNVYFNGTDNKYISADYATYYQQNNGVHIWATAASGTANATISFTQAMTLDASGDLAIGTTTGSIFSTGGVNVSVSNPSGIATIAIGGSTGNSGYLELGQGSVRGALIEGSTNTMIFYTNGTGSGTSVTEAARITSDRNLLVGETASNSGNNGLKVKGQFALTTAQTFTASGSVNDSAYYIVCYSLSATCTLTLPTPANNTGRLLNIVVQSAQQVVSASSNVTAIADGSLGTAILPATAGKWVQLWCDGAYWNIIATNV